MDDYEERRKELDALVEESSTYIVRCYECPVRVPCSYADDEIAWNAELTASLPVSDYNLNDAIGTLEAMKKIGKACPMLHGCDHTFGKRKP